MKDLLQRHHMANTKNVIFDPLSFIINHVLSFEVKRMVGLRRFKVSRDPGLVGTNKSQGRDETR